MDISKDDGRDIIDLRGEDDAEFKIKRFDNSKGGESAVVPEIEQEFSKPTNKIKVKFDKFVTLILNHHYQEIFDKYMDEDIVVSTDLLTDLANSHEEKPDKKITLIFIFGILLGLVVALIIFKT